MLPEPTRWGSLHGYPLETIEQVANRPPVAPSLLNAGIAPAIEAICLRCLHKEPVARYATARELAVELERFAAGQNPVNPKPQTESKSRSRHKGKVLASLAASALAAALVTVVFQSRIRPVQDASVAQSVLILTPPSSGRISQGESYNGEGKVELIPSLSAFGARSHVVAFDLSTEEQPYLDKSLTQNAKIWDEDRHGIRYWGPIDDHLKFEVVYRIPFDFPVRAASLYASLTPVDDDAKQLAVLEVSTDAGKSWAEVARGGNEYPHGGPTDISDNVRESHVIYVRAVMKGRDDHDGSATAQFLRTSTLADGHLNVKSPYVFELRAYDREVPIVTGTVRFDGTSWALWPREDGSFTVERSFANVGSYEGEITFRTAKIETAPKVFQVWVNTPGWSISIKPVVYEIRERERILAQGRLIADHVGALSGVVDYDDSSGYATLKIGVDGAFRLEHAYATARRYAPRVTIQDQDGHMATEILTCVVLARESSSNVSLLDR
jgi:hypothetical protein